MVDMIFIIAFFIDGKGDNTFIVNTRVIMMFLVMGMMDWKKIATISKYLNGYFNVDNHDGDNIIVRFSFLRISVNNNKK